jgi:glycosyltransferase involved in cell wall biosynthesis
MRLTILSVAFPFAPVGPDAVGGAEQVLTRIDEALVAAGHRSIVIACAGSETKGTLVPIPRIAGEIDEEARRRIHAASQRAVERVLARCPVDLVHLHGIDFYAYLPPPGAPALVTLHLSVSWYPADALRLSRPQTWFNCVSRFQQEDCRGLPNLIGPIENGIPVEAFAARHAKRSFALVLARVCAEKGIHLAIDAAKRADLPLIIAGEIFDYPEHRRYFDEEIRPRLDRKRRFIGPLGFERKRRLLAAARCVVVPSLVPETSSLVAREALASGTPVVALARGALVETIEHGRTRFLVEHPADMAEAMLAAPRLDLDLCRNVANARFRVERMTAAYFAAYERLARGPAAVAEAAWASS